MTTRHTNPEGRQGVTPRQRLAAYALGLAGGMGVNTLSNDFGYRGMATAAAAAAILISTNWLRQLPSQAPLPRIVSRVLLGGAALAAIVAAANPSWEGPATIAATILTTLAVLIPTALERTTELLFGVALIGAGVALIGAGVAILRDGDVLFGVALIGGGVAVIGVGVAILRDGDVLLGVAVIGGGVAVIGVGVASLLDGDVLFGVAGIGGGVAGIGAAVAILRRTGIFVHPLTWLAALTKAPDGDASHNDDPTV